MIERTLREKAEKGLLRELRSFDIPSSFDFFSNDYLGFAQDAELFEEYLNELREYGWMGSTGSRLISGNIPYIETLEDEIASFHEGEASLFFNSGYQANVGLLSALSGKGNTILLDERIHASIKDGARMGFAKVYSFQHNDLDDLHRKLKKAQGSTFVVIEGSYSMDGDSPDIPCFLDRVEKFGAKLIVDEAHTLGIRGDQGEGIVQEMGEQGRVFARVFTFGKALGQSGAVVVGSKELRRYLVNQARSFIYTTAPPGNQIVAVKVAYDRMKGASIERKELGNVIAHFKTLAQQVENFDIPDRNGPIQNVFANGKGQVQDLALKLQENGFGVKAILSPTVPKGEERLRISLHSYNTSEALEGMFRLMFEKG